MGLEIDLEQVRRANADGWRVGFFKDGLPEAIGKEEIRTMERGLQLYPVTEEVIKQKEAQ